MYNNDMFMAIIAIVGILLGFIMVFAIPVLISFITKIIVEKKTKKQYTIRVYSMSLFIVFTLFVMALLIGIILAPDVAFNSTPNPDDIFEYNPKLGLSGIIYILTIIPISYFWIMKNIVKKVEPNYKKNVELIDIDETIKRN
ncbi:hypothetical protein IJ182_06535 [bacterium]|nr:hypothetical protein [bacterium]